MMLVLLDAGIRISELCELRLESMHDGFLMIFGKGRKEREVGISPTTAKLLWKYINMHRVASDDSVTALFTGVRGEPLRPSGARKVVERIKLAAGIEDIPVTPHKFRHTFARSWLERGGEVYSLSRLLGHSSVKVTETYLEDFTSRQARVHHVKFSALNDLKVRKQGRGHHRYRHYKQLPSEEEGSDETTTERE
jgi:integrase/recombinase XerD